MTARATDNEPTITVTAATWTFVPDEKRFNTEDGNLIARWMRDDPLRAWKVAAAMMADATGFPVTVSFRVLTGRAAKKALERHEASLVVAASQPPPTAGGA